MPQHESTPALVTCVGLGGALGALGRYTVDQLMLPLVLDGPLPAFSATLSVNFLGSLLIGLVAVLLADERRGRTMENLPLWRAFLITGVLGGLTTASLFSLELLWHLQAGLYGAALVYVLLTMCLCPLCAWLGYRLGRGWQLRRLRLQRNGVRQ